MKKSKKNKMLKEWKKRLGLQDWTVVLVDHCEPEEMLLENVAGSSEYTESIKSGCIRILNPKYYGDKIVPFDYEKILVHELLHLKMSLISDSEDDLQARFMHQMIDDLARAFVDAKRCKNV